MGWHIIISQTLTQLGLVATRCR